MYMVILLHVTQDLQDQSGQQETHAIYVSQGFNILSRPYSEIGGKKIYTVQHSLCLCVNEGGGFKTFSNQYLNPPAIGK